MEFGNRSGLRAFLVFLMVFGGPVTTTMAGSLSLGFDEPIAIAGVGGELFVLETSGQVQVVETDGAPSIVRTIGSPGTGSGELQSPQDIVADPWGGIVVADAGNARLARFQVDGQFVAEVVVDPFPQRLVADASHVYSLRFDEPGLVIDKFDSQLNLVSTLDVSSSCGFRDFAAVMGAMTVDDTGAIWVAELTGCGEDYVIRRYDADGTLQGSWARPAGQISPQTLEARGYSVLLVNDLFAANGELYVLLGAGGAETGGLEADVWTSNGTFSRRIKLQGPARPIVRTRVISSKLYLTDPHGTEAVVFLDLTSIP